MQGINAQPVVIIGAGRSGTNILRDVLTNLEGVETWPCDEINYIWRYGNRTNETDEFDGEMATPVAKKYIRKEFNKIISRSSLQSLPVEKRYIVEKTCANSLRVTFVSAVLPEAKFVYIVRDGRDVVSSALKRWKAPLDIRYIFAKAKYVPISDLPYYGFSYIKNRMAKLFSSESSVAVWGPRFSGMKQLSVEQSLAHVCSVQWVKCVLAADKSFAMLNSEKAIKIKYEDFVAKPTATLEKIVDFIGADFSSEEISSACIAVKTSSVGKGKEEFMQVDNDCYPLMESTLIKHNYI